MKKILIRTSIVLLILIIVAVLVVGMFLGNIVKAGMNTVAPSLTQTTFTVDSVSVSILTGSAGVNGLAIGNPEGYDKSANAISVGKAAVSIAPMSILGDKVVIKSIEVRDAEINFSGMPVGGNNLKKLMDNVNAAAGGGAAAKPATNTPAANKPAKKLEVDSFIISGAKVHFNGVPLPLPTIELHDLGKGPDGITPVQLTKEVLGQVTTAALEAVVKAAEQVGKEAVGAAKDAGKAVGDSVNKIGKGIGGLFKK